MLILPKIQHTMASGSTVKKIAGCCSNFFRVDGNWVSCDCLYYFLRYKYCSGATVVDGS